jgi:hypothetical protein
MTRRLLRCAAIAAAALLAACSADPVSPDGVLSTAPSTLLAPKEGVRLVSDSVDDRGNTILVQEFGMGYYTLPNGDGASVASVTIRSSIPVWPEGATYFSPPCITHSIVATETTPGSTISIKKSGGCDKDVVILIEQKATRRKATFSFSMVFGKTVIDAGQLR